MAKCNLRIKFEGDPRFKPGETIRGSVFVDVDKECKCDKFTVTQEWRTHGKGNVASDEIAEETMFQGVWQPGQYEYLFEFVAASKPLSYRGELLNVDWYVKARADVPWAIDPKAEADFLLIPGAKSEAENSEKQDYSDVLPPYPNHETPKSRKSCGAFVFLAIGLALLSVGLIKTLGGDGSSVMLAVFGGIFTCIALFVVYSSLRSHFAEKKLGPVAVLVKPSKAGAGEDLFVKIRFRPTANLALNKISATLFGEEVVTRGSGSNRSTYRHTVCSDEKTFDVKPRLRMGEEVILEEIFKLPDNAGPSFSAVDNELKWCVKLRVDIPRWPDWMEEYEIIVNG